MLGYLTDNALCPCCIYPMGTFGKRTAPKGRPRSAFVCSDERPTATPLVADLRIDHATVVDTLDGTLVADVTILIAEGRIVSVAKDGEGDTSPALRRVDATGKFVVPGYNDMHSHVLNLDDPSGGLALMLTEGVTGFRQMSGSEQRLRERRDGTLAVGDEAPALLEMPGAVLTPLNASTVEGLIAEVAAQKEQGADFIKVAFVAPAVFNEALAAARREGLPILGHLQDGVDVDVSARAGFRSIEHLGPGATLWVACSTEEAALQSATKPVRIPSWPLKIPFMRRLIEKRFQRLLINPSAFVPPAYATRMQRAMDTFSQGKFEALVAVFAAQQTWHCPTLVRLRTQELADAPEYQSHPDLRYMPQKRIDLWRQVTEKFKKLPAAMRSTYAEAYPRQLQLMKALSDAGVRMIAGTDGGWLAIPGLNLQEEFAELAKAGIAPLKILQMTTINAAEYLDRTDTMGTVAPGRNADLVLLDANPLEDAANLGAIAGVVRAGVHYARPALDALRDRVAANRGSMHAA